MNVKMMSKMAERAGLKVRTVVANDDVASAPKSEIAKRRGVAGEILMWKVGGAAAARGDSLDEVIRLAQKTIDYTRSVGTGPSSCVIPAVDKANFTIKDGEMEVGIGHHGEPGIQVTNTRSAHDMADLMLDLILPDLPIQKGDEVVVLVSGLGATPLMEQYILYGELARRLDHDGVKVHRAARQQAPDLAQALDDLAMTLLEGIGGSMGPLYGGFFLAMSEVLDGQANLARDNFGAALDAGVIAVQDVGSAKVGDKTLIDTLVPARDAYQAALDAGQPFAACLNDMVAAAKKGQESTKDLQARLGRAARLGERSIGVLDAGATSCSLILESMARSIEAGLATQVT